MTKPIRHEVDGLTGITTEIELTAEEIAEREAEEAAFKAEQIAAEEAKANAKAAVLAKLNLTEDELRAALA